MSELASLPLNAPQRYSVWQHYKDPTSRYLVLGTARHSATLEWLVLYTSGWQKPVYEAWARPLSEWYDEIDGVSRFTLVPGRDPQSGEKA